MPDKTIKLKSNFITNDKNKEWTKKRSASGKERSTLKSARTRRNMSAETLGKLIGVSKTTIYRYESGETDKMPVEVVRKLAKILNVSPLYIMGIEDEPGTVKEKLIQKSKTINIPVLGTIACGDPITAEENIERYIEEPQDSLPNGNIFYLAAKGKSMEPTIPDGSMVLIKEQPEVEDGEIAAVLVNSDSEATLKRIKYQKGMVILMPDNPSFNPIILTKDNPGRIIGKAIRYTTDLWLKLKLICQI